MRRENFQFTLDKGLLMCSFSNNYSSDMRGIVLFLTLVTRVIGG